MHANLNGAVKQLGLLFLRGGVTLSHLLLFVAASLLLVEFVWIIIPPCFLLSQLVYLLRRVIPLALFVWYGDLVVGKDWCKYV